MKFIRRMWNSKIINWLLLFVILFQIFVIIYFGMKKSNLYGDEILTFNLANRYYEPFLGNAGPYFNRWLSSDFWNTVITVSGKHRFAYDSVYYNQARDVHPPFYYYLIHTICSFFPGVFSKWFGILPNIVFFILTQLVIYQIGNTITANRIFSISLVIFYGFSWGIINNIVYIRMYAMLSFWAIVSFYLHIKLIKQFNHKILFLTLLTAWLGTLTQYYFLVYQFFVSLGFCIYLLWHKKKKELIQYSLGFLLVMILAVGYFPPLINHFTKTTQGKTAFQNLYRSSYIDRIKTFAHIISKDLFGAHILWAIKGYFAILIFKGISKILNIKGNLTRKYVEVMVSMNHNKLIAKYDFQEKDYIVIYMAFVSLFYFSVISKVAPYFVSRYLVIIYPLISFVFIYFLSKLILLFTQCKLAIISITCVISLICAVKFYDKVNLFQFNKDLCKVEQVIRGEKGDIAFLVVNQNENWWPTINQTLTMKETDQSYMLREEKLKQLGNILKDYNNNHSKILVYQTNSVKTDEKKFIQKLKTYSGYDKCKLLDNYIGKIYLLEK